MASTATARIGDSALAARLAHEIEGEVRFDRFTRGRYATDASIYQVEPIGVVVPKTENDLRAAVQIAREEMEKAAIAGKVNYIHFGVGVSEGNRPEKAQGTIEVPLADLSVADKKVERARERGCAGSRAFARARSRARSCATTC